MKKYKLLKRDYVMYEGIKLYRIKALRSFSDVKKGDLGGYVANEYNISHDDASWVYDTAMVFNPTLILGDMKVYGNIAVYDNGRIIVCL